MQLAAVYLATEVVHSSDVNVLNVVQTLIAPAIDHVSTIIASIHAIHIHRAHQMPFASFGIMWPAVNVQNIYQAAIHCRIANELYQPLDQNVTWMKIVQADWHVSAINALNHAKSLNRALNQHAAAFWTVHQYEQ